MPLAGGFRAVIENMAEMATALDEVADAAKYGQMLAAGRTAYHKQFYDPKAKVYGKGSQCSAMMALWIGAVPDALESDILNGLVANIQTAYGGNHLVCSSDPFSNSAAPSLA